MEPYLKQAKPSRSYKIIAIFSGILLGFCAPLGYLLLRVISSSKLNLDWVRTELSEYSLVYSYLAILTPMVFAVFGLCFGELLDRVHRQKRMLEKLNVVLANQSITDDLTGLYNHRHILVLIDREVERAKRYGRLLSGMMIDMDDFKSANDLYGHLTGDSVIRETADVIRNGVRNVDIVGRFGGDEFLVILPEASAEAAKVVAERVLQNIRDHSFKTGRDYISITVSIGVFSIQDPKDFDKTIFLDKIDRAMFRSKEDGKNRIYSA